MDEESGFRNLFKPSYIAGLGIKNRIVMPPMGTEYASEGGYVTERLIEYYSERARGGVGLVIVETTCIDNPVGKRLIRELAIDSDEFVPGLRKLAQAIKAQGAGAAIQLCHSGRASRASITQHLPVGPSNVPMRGYEPCRELSIAEIDHLIALFGQAAKRAKACGFDGIEIHAAHHHLVANFLSAAWNNRQDRYGGELENRTRFLISILRAAKQSAGKDFPVWCRINAAEYGMQNGVTIDEAKEIARMAQNAGADAVHVSCFGVGPYAQANMPDTPGALIPLAAEIKRVVVIPVIAVGRISPEVGEAALRDSKADFVALGRALLADPYIPTKLAQGKLYDIIPCIACFRCLEHSGLGFEPNGLKCTVNPVTGREAEYIIKSPEKTRTVLVVGGGPAGMEAGRVAALRGHQVMLYEKRERLGGQLILASIPPHKKERIGPLINYMATQVRRLGVHIELGKEATPELIESIGPDAVVLATGVSAFVPEIPGIEGAHVVTAEEALTGKATVGERVIVIGGELVGCETAEFLAEKGKRVTITRRGPRMATKTTLMRRSLLDRLIKKGVIMLTGVKYERFEDNNLIIITKEGEKKAIEADTTVLAAGARPHRELYKSLEGKVAEIYMAGDCVEPRGIGDAITDGFRIAHAL